MEVLDENLIAKIRSSTTINSVTQCVTELVLNSLDAKATSVAIRVNLATFRIQVVDNGKGISRSNLESVGKRYMTSKCHTLEDLKKNLKYYGFKGEALATICQLSQSVTVTTRAQNCEETFKKIIEKNEIKIDSAKQRPSVGTTVTVENFLGNLPVRQQCVKHNELENVKRSVESLIIIHPRVSFTLRDDLGGGLVLSSVKCQDIVSSFKTIHPKIDETGFALFKAAKNKTSVEGLVHKESHENKRLQYIYVNKRPINCPKIQNLINSIFKKFGKNEKRKNPVFVLHVKCPYSEVDINLEPAKTGVFFKKFDIVKRCIEKVVNAFFGGEVQVNSEKTKKAISEFGVSQIGGVVKGVGTKRKIDELEDDKIIEDTPFFEKATVPSKQTKMALPIEIKKNERKENFVDADNSIFTNFPENEKTGKDLIMDMFVMSLKVFPAENIDEKSPSKSPLIQDLSSSPIKSPNIVTLGVQTTPNKEMISTGVQTEFNTFAPNVTFFPRKSLKNFVSDYDFDFSRIDAFPVFNFGNKSSVLPVFDNSNQTRKLFDFRENRRNFGNFNHICENFEQEPILEHKPKEFRLSQQNRNGACTGNELEIISRDSLIDDFDISGCMGPKNLNPVGVTFIKPKAKKRLDESTVSRYFEPRKAKISRANIWNNVTIDKRPKRKKSLDESTVSKYFVQKKGKICKEKALIKKRSLNDSTVSKYFASKKPKVHSQRSKNVNISFEKSVPDMFHVSSSSQDLRLEDEESNLIITIDENDKEKILGRERISEDVAPTLAQNQDGWVSVSKELKKAENVNKKDFTFEISERFDFVPKGLSPILKDYGKVDDLSPESKEKLQNVLIQSYEDELLLIKWQNYIDNRDPKKFFEEIYLEKSKQIESSIPNINKTGYAKHVKGFEHMSFTKKLFENLEVIGQVDRKFIAALDKRRKLLLLFDQHAVHERVLLEELSESYKGISTRLSQSITIFLPQNDLILLKRQKENLNSLGLVLDFFSNGVTVFEVSLCLYNKSRKGVDITSLTQDLIREILETLKISNGIIVNVPRIMQNIINSEACRGAIKFGDLLSKPECGNHLQRLCGCKLPFQCAHGRPTVTPLLFLNKLYDPLWSKPQLKNLK